MKPGEPFEFHNFHKRFAGLRQGVYALFNALRGQYLAHKNFDELLYKNVINFLYLVCKRIQ